MKKPHKITKIGNCSRFTAKMKAAEEIMHEDRNILHELALG